MTERVTKVGYDTIITDRDEYARTNHPEVWRRCSDNMRGEIIVEDTPYISFVAQESGGD